MEIKRSPFKIVVDKDMTLTIDTKEFESGYVVWPIYESEEGKTFLQENFIFNTPKGCDVIKVTIPTRLGIQICKCIIMDADNDLVIFKNALSAQPVYGYIGVTENRAYKLKVEPLTAIDSKYGNLKIEWSYNINHSELTCEDYHDDENE